MHPRKQDIIRIVLTQAQHPYYMIGGTQKHKDPLVIDHRVLDVKRVDVTTQNYNKA